MSDEELHLWLRFHESGHCTPEDNCGCITEAAQAIQEADDDDFPTDAEVGAARSRCIHGQMSEHTHAPHEDMTCAYSDDHAVAILDALAPLIRAREAAAWDARPSPWRHTNPYRQEADDDRD